MSKFVDDEAKKTNTGREIRSLWRNQILGTLFFRLAEAQEFKKIQIMVEIAKISGLYEATVIDRLESRISQLIS